MSPPAQHPSCRGSRRSPSMRKAALFALVVPLISVVSAQTSADSIPARWGQASALVGSLFVVQGGKTQGTTGGGYTYNSAPSDAQMYALDLSSSFPLSSPPWQSVTVQEGTTAAPSVSFHTISPLNVTSLLLFGGDASPAVPVQTGNDSAYILHLGGSSSNHTVQYRSVPTTWSQPMRRMGHTSESNAQGSVWIVGGQKADGSGIQLDQEWSIDTTASSPSFQLVASSPPGSLVGASSTLLSDGTLLLLGGLDASGQLQSMQNLFAYSSKSSKWTQTATQSSSNTTVSARQNAFPAPRRDHVAVSLPNQRVFIQGGASADLSTVYSDAWILDWSVNPPVWTEINSTAGPGPRFGHSAVAYGREVLISFGWAGGNAAPTGLHLFDASTLTASASSTGSWSGGTWSDTTYTPDPLVSSGSSDPSSGSSGSSTSSSSSASGNGSSSSSGGSPPSSSASSNSDNGSNASGTDTGSSSGSFPTDTNSHGDGGTANTDSSSGSGSSDGVKAGAAVGAIIGVGLVLGAGYAVYRRRSLNNYRRYGDGSVGLLGFGARRAGESADDDNLMEKGWAQSDYDRPYHRADGEAALTGGYAFGRKRGRNEGSPWAAANVGHAMEGSGPHFRERIAIFAGRGKRDTHLGPRFDMLADEGDANSLFRPRGANGSGQTYNPELEEEAESPVWHDRHLREHSYAHIGDDEDLSSGDLGRLQPEGEEETELDAYSPFEDRPEEASAGRTLFATSAAAAAAAAAGARGYGKLADREVEEGGYDSDRRSYDGRSVDTHEDPSSGPSVQSHSTTSKSDVPSSSRSLDVLSPGGLVSFSDASHGRHSGQQMKRSPTWWDRFMGSSSVERSASGRFLSGPNANLPIRDPAPPPVSGLEAITESPRSRDVSEAQPANPFADPTAPLPLDEMGRRISPDGTADPHTAHTQGPSISSIGSARTGASSHFESRLRGMDVVQRVRTGSSRRTQSTRASDTDSEPALSRGPTLLRPRNVASSEALGDEVAEGSTPGSVVWRPEDFRGLDDVAEETAVSSKTADRRRSNVSETPSITPLTTKRARLNPVMISPLFPSAHPHRPPHPTTAPTSVKDKVKIFESATTPTTAPSSAWTATLSAKQRPTSPQGAAGKQKLLLTHGLAPKPQLFVANPDDSLARRSGP